MDAAELKRTIGDWQAAGWVAELHRLVSAARDGPADRMEIRMLNVRAAVMAERGRDEEAVADWRRSLELDVLQPGVRRDLAAALLRLGRLGGADDEAFGLSMAQVADAAPAATQPDRAPVGYMRRLFDRLAERYDGTMTAAQDYAGPRVLAGMVTDALAGAVVETALDAGCGTGLAAPLLRPLAGRLDGTDVSPGMLAQARARSAYDRLEVADLPDYLARHAGAYDLIFCAGVLGAFGDLDPLIAAVARSLRPGGVLGLTADTHRDGDAYRVSHNVFQLFTHSEEALRKGLSSQGLSVLGARPYVDRLVEGHAAEAIAVDAVAITARRPAAEDA